MVDRPRRRGEAALGADQRPEEILRGDVVRDRHHPRRSGKEHDREETANNCAGRAERDRERDGTLPLRDGAVNARRACACATDVIASGGGACGDRGDRGPSRHRGRCSGCRRRPALRTTRATEEPCSTHVFPSTSRAGSRARTRPPCACTQFRPRVKRTRPPPDHRASLGVLAPKLERCSSSLVGTSIADGWMDDGLSCRSARGRRIEESKLTSGAEGSGDLRSRGRGRDRGHPPPPSPPSGARRRGTRS